MSVDSPPATPRRQPAGAPRAVGGLRIAGRLVQPQLNRIAGPEPGPAIQVEPKVMEVLLCLAATPGEVVTREALLDRVWQGAFVSDDVLTRSIGQLRRIFGDDVERPRVIETIRKRGYRLLAVPEPAPEAAPAIAAGETAAGVTAAGATATGGTATGEAAAGETTTGGTSDGGSATGGSATDGSAAGGSAADGSATRGTSAGETATGGTVTGETATGGTSDGGTSDGGSATGGSATRGTAAGEAAAGGSSTGGSATGRTAARGTAAGGTAAGETATRGIAAGDSATEESATGRTAAGGAAWHAGRPATVVAVAAVAAIATLAVIATVAALAPWLARRAALRPGPDRAPARAVRLLPVAGVPANATRPALSPDGARVAFSWNGGSGNDLRLFVAGLAAGSPTAITAHAAPALDLDPRWSPDGTLIAFARQTRGGCQLLIVPVAGGPERRLVPCAGDYTGTSWSADGRWLAYAARPARDAAASGPPPVRLRLLDLVTLRSRDLTSPPSGIEGDHAPAFSPDGLRLVFVRTIADDVEDLFQVAVDLGPAPATSETASPRAGGGAMDGIGDAGARYGAGESGTSNGPGTSGQPVRVTFDDAGIAGVDWLPNGSDLVLSSDRGGIYSLWRVPAAGGTPRLLAGSGAKTKHPSTARRADVVVFESWLYDIGIWRTPLGPGTAAPGAAARATATDATAAGTPAADAPAGAAPAGHGAPSPAPAPLGTATREWSFQPQYSPDGRRIVFGSTRSGTYELWLADADGGHPVQLTAMGGPHLGAPRWSPDGRRIAFTAWPEGRAGLYLVPAAGGAPTPLTPAAGDAAGEMAPSWSRDGGSLYFVSRRSGSWQAWNLRLATGRRVQVTFDGATSAAESADGRDLLFTRPDRPGIWRRALAAPGWPALAAAPGQPALAAAPGQPAFAAAPGRSAVPATPGRSAVPMAPGSSAFLLAPALAPGDWGSWTVTGDGIYYLDRTRDDLPTVDFLPAGQARPQVVAALPALSWSGFAVSPDRRSLLYARAGSHDCTVVRLENP